MIIGSVKMTDTVFGISVARALIAIKHFPQQLHSDLESRFSGVIKQDKELKTGLKKAAFQSQATSKIKSIEDSIENELQRRIAISKANQNTMVAVNGKQYSIADLLIIKQHIIPRKTILLEVLKNQEKQALLQYEKEISLWEKEFKDVENRELAESLKPELISFKSKIDELEKEILFFDKEVDTLLTEKNPVTMI